MLLHSRPEVGWGHTKIVSACHSHPSQQRNRNAVSLLNGCVFSSVCRQRKWDKMARCLRDTWGRCWSG